MAGGDEAAQLAEAILMFRRDRSRVVSPELFGEPGWELLLELFIADASGHRLTGRQVADRSDVRHSVMARWVKHLSMIGLVVGDGDGNLDDGLTLSGAGMAQTEQILGQARVLSDAFLRTRRG